MKNFIKIAVNEALKGIQNNEGGPFGAVVVLNNKVISKAHNEVIKRNDPTAHAEIMAIRKAAAKLKRPDLSDCVIYSTCEPCPMCLGAILWARIKTIHYGSSRAEAALAGFDDEIFYKYLKGNSHRPYSMNKIISDDSYRSLFEEWERKTDKIQY